MATGETGPIVLRKGEAPGHELHGSRLDYLMTGKSSKGCSLFVFDTAPGFDTGAHYHTKIEEFFYVLDGELDVRCGDDVVHAGSGTFVFVPPMTPHGFANRGSKTARVLIGCVPPGHENYFDELVALVKKGRPDPAVLAELRKKYDTIQLEGMQTK